MPFCEKENLRFYIGGEQHLEKITTVGHMRYYCGCLFFYGVFGIFYPIDTSNILKKIITNFRLLMDYLMD